MANLYYGGGNCSIEGSEVRCVQIQYTGAISIKDKTSDSFAIAQQSKGILIFPIGDGFLNDLFDYNGEFKIKSVIVADNDGQRISTSIHRVMDYTELLNTNAEDMTTNSEDLKQTYATGRKVSKTSIDKANINNLHTSKHNGNLFLEDGTLYEGYFHVHVSDNSAMTEREHSEHSKDLYYENNRPTRNLSTPNRVRTQRTTNRSSY